MATQIVVSVDSVVPNFHGTIQLSANPRVAVEESFLNAPPGYFDTTTLNATNDVTTGVTVVLDQALTGSTREDFSATFETSGQIIFVARQLGNILILTGVGSDTEEPYTWVPSNLAEVTTFRQAVPDTGTPIILLFSDDTITTDIQNAYMLADTEPSPPVGGTGSENIPTGWSATEPDATLTQAVYRMDRRRVLADGAFRVSTNWGNVTETQPMLTLSAPSFADDTGDAISSEVGTAITNVTVPEADGVPDPTYAVVGTLPDGLQFDTTTRVLSGTPNAAGSGTITIRATNSEGSDDWTVDYTFTASTVTIEQTFNLQATHFLDRSSSVGWNIPGGLRLAVDDAFEPAGENRFFSTIYLYDDGRVELRFTSSQNEFSGDTGDDLIDEFETTGSFVLEAGGETLTAALDSADLTEPYQWTPSNSADVIAFENAFDGDGNGTLSGTLTIRYERQITPPVFADDTGTPVTWTRTRPILGIQVPAATGAPVPTYSAAGLPQGILFDPDTLVISGTPQVIGSGTITITATNSQGTDEWTLAYAITGITSAPRFVDSTGPDQTWTALATNVNITVPSAGRTRGPDAEQTITLESGWWNRSPGAVWWQPPEGSRPRIDDALTPAANPSRFLGDIAFVQTGAFRLRIANTQTQNLNTSFDDLSDQFEQEGQIEVVANGRDIIVEFNGLDAGDTYSFVPGNAGDVRAFYRGVTTAVSGTLTLRDYNPADAPSPAATYAVVGTLPDGLTFDPDTRVISGVLETNGSGTITIRATNDQGSDDWTFDYQIELPDPPVSLREPNRYHYLEQAHFPTVTAAATTEEAEHPARYVPLAEIPHVHWRSSDVTETTLTITLPQVTQVFGIAFLGVNADATVTVGPMSVMFDAEIDQESGLGNILAEFVGGLFLTTIELTFAADADRVNGADYFRVGTVVVFGEPLTALDNAPIRPSSEVWETEQEDKIEEKQFILPPDHIVDWEARPQTDDDFDRWSDLAYRRDLRDLVLWSIPGYMVFLGRIEGDIEREDYSENLDFWRMRWVVL